MHKEEGINDSAKPRTSIVACEAAGLADSARERDGAEERALISGHVCRRRVQAVHDLRKWRQ